MGLFVLPSRHFPFIGVLLGKTGNHLLGFTFGAVHNNLNANQRLIKVLEVEIDGQKLIKLWNRPRENNLSPPSRRSVHPTKFVMFLGGMVRGDLFHSTLKVIHKGNTCLVPCLMSHAQFDPMCKEGH
jgi:hypothetical protein